MADTKQALIVKAEEHEAKAREAHSRSLATTQGATKNMAREDEYEHSGAAKALREAAASLA